MQHLVIRASAGSGKTYQLTNRYLQRLMEGVAADEILAATFTRKAAGEILQRVLVRLAEAASDESRAAGLSQDLGAGRFGSREFRTCLVRLVRDLHRLRVGTLDSFFARLATNFTLEIGLPPGWRIVDERIDQHLRAQAIAAVLRSDRTADIARLTYLLSKGRASRSVSGLIADTVDHFFDVYRESEPAAWRPFPALQRLTNDQVQAAIDVIESAELPPHQTIEKGRRGNVSAARAGNWEQFISKGIAGKLLNGETTYCGRPLADGVIAAYRPLLHHARAVLVQELAEQTWATRQLLERFDVEYRRLKREQRGLRFDDVTHSLRGLFAVQDAQGLAYRLDGHVWHLLLDEFQDTSPIQWDVLRPFAQRITSGGSPSSFFCVGDTKQAIYAWRGGVAEIFDALEDDLQGLNEMPLAKSYRSSPPVIRFVNALFTGMTRHPNLDQDEATIRSWCDAFTEHSTARTELPGYACVRVAAISERDDESGERDDDEDAIDNILPGTAKLVADIVQEAPSASVGVLLRRNDEVAAVMNLLRHEGIPASEEGGNPITDSAAVLVILSLVRLSDHPGDTAGRFHVATSPLGEALAYRDYLDDVAADALAADIRTRLLRDGYGPTIDSWSRLLERDATTRDRMRLGQLVELGYRFDAEATLRPVDFVRFVSQEQFGDPSADRVRVMTVHAAKGLQFDVVVAPLTERRLRGQPPAYVANRISPAGPIERICLYRNQDIQRLLPAKLQDTFADARAREVRETLCRLYVTATRAIYALHVLVPASSTSEKKLPLSPAGLVRAALTDGNRVWPGEILYEEGDRWWYRKLKQKEESAAAAAATASAGRGATSPDAIRVRLADMPNGRRRGLARAAPSRHRPREPVPLGPVLRSGNRDTRRRGTVIHAWFEQLAWLEDPRPTEAQLLQIARHHGLSADAAAPLVGEFVEMLEHPQLVALLSRSSYSSPDRLPYSGAVNRSLLSEATACDVRREQMILAKRGGEVLSGTIDRLVLLRRGPVVLAADIIDFKTDDVSPTKKREWSERIELYRFQLAAYAAAISDVYALPRERIAVRLVFLKPLVVVPVDITESLPQ